MSVTAVTQLLCCAASIWVSITSAPAETVRLSDLDLSKMTTGWSVPKTNAGIMGTPLRIGGKTFARGVGTHAESRLRVDLGGKASRFFAQVGVDDSAGAQGSIEFIISGDGKVLWRSGLMTGGKAPIPVDLKIGGIRFLVLTVTDGDDGSNNDHADWAEAGIEMQPGAPSPSALPAYELFALKSKNFTLEFQVGDDRRLYQHAIGTGPGPATPLEPLQRNDEAYPQWGDGYICEPALQVTHADGNTSTTLLYESATHTSEAPDRELLRIGLRDPAYPFNVTLCFRAHRQRDLIEQWTEIRNGESRTVKLDRMASSSLLLSTNSVYLTHFFGDWASEMQPVTEMLTPGMKVLDSKLGVRAHQFGNPSFILSWDGAPNETSGRVLGGSLAWSGSFQCAFDHNGRTTHALCGINPFASAYTLRPNETFTTPTMIWVWSDNGLGEMSRKFHSWAREFAIRDGHEPRTVLLNNWEATGFDFDFNRIAGLFGPAREIGAELFLLDDGWFGNKYPRTNDSAGLGDWQPNRQRLPRGLAPLAAEAVKHGLRFGIWLEPEMVNPKSDLFERHPDWVIAEPRRELELQRNQLVLDLTRPEVQKFETKVIKDILSTPGITYAKWDCNRYLTQPGSSWLPPERQSHLWIDYVRALYALMDKTAKTFPKTELMLCSGGGGRVDYGALRYFHEFWPSDNTDPVVRAPMQWNYSYFFPAMTIASHVTHWGNRPMHFTCSVAMSARFGMDLDLTKLPSEDRAVCAGAIKAYKQIRDVTQLGDLYRLEQPLNAARGAINFVSPDRSRAVLFVFHLKDGEATAVRPQGLDPVKSYQLHELNPPPGRAKLAAEDKTMRGEELMRDGILPSCSKALEASVIELTAVATNHDYWAIEDPKTREKLPLYKIVPAARPDELTPANGYPKAATFLTWHRSHGDNGGMRYSALDEINRQNVSKLQQAWIYHSGDGSNQIQCNPIIVRGIMIAPTAGQFMVGISAETGKELWRFKPEGRPAFRGLIYADERVLFCAGKYLYALNPTNGNVISEFGENGHALLPGRVQGGFGAATACPAIFKDIIVVPGFEKDVWGFDVQTGKHLWTFHTVPHPGEFGYDTWDHAEDYGANCWSGMAMDEVRGIAYISTGGPKPNFIGITHLGDNLFANCLIALDARTGRRLWHFQEIPHDLWDRDISAPPNLATITRDGKRVDVVAVTTKNGDTLLLDRVTGKPIFPFRMHRAPTSDLPGEVTAPYQPDPELPERFAKMEFTAADLTDRTPEAAEFATVRFKSVTTGFFRPASLGHPNLFWGMDGGAEWSGACIDPTTGRLYVSANHLGWMISVFRDDDAPEDTKKPKTEGRVVYEKNCVTCHGQDLMGIGVAPPLRGLRFRISDSEIALRIRTGTNGMPAFPNLSDAEAKSLADYLLLRDRAIPPANKKAERPRYNFTGYPRFLDNEGYPASKPPWGTLNCLDLNTGKLIWKVPLGEYPELAAQGTPVTGTENYGGAIVTAGGLLFCSGTRDAKIRAFDKDSGAELWSGKLPWVGSAPPTTYAINGRQFVVIASTGNKLGKQSEYGDAYVAFALPAMK